MAAIARAQGIAKANNFAQIESLYGLPAGTLAALILQESGANAGAKSHTGATGLFKQRVYLENSMVLMPKVRLKKLQQQRQKTCKNTTKNLVIVQKP